MFEKLITKTRVFKNLLKEAESFRDLLIKCNQEKNNAIEHIKELELREKQMINNIKEILKLLKDTDNLNKRVKDIKKICKELLK